MKKLFIVLLLITVSISNFFAMDVPYLAGRVNDYASILTDEFKSKLTEKLSQHETATSNQIVVLTMSSLEDENLEMFANKVFETWKIGQKDKNNGVLLLISINDKKLRIEVGYGLEGALPDAVCSSIIRNEIVPQFRKADYAAGIDAGVNSIISAIKGEYVNEEKNELEKIDDFQSMEFPYNIIFGIFIVSFLSIFAITWIFSKGCMSWFLYIFLIPFYATFPVFIIGVVPGLTLLGIYIVGYPLIKIIFGSKFGQNFLQTKFPKIYKSYQSGVKWSSGSSSGRSWSSSGGHSSSSYSSGGGGFSGGGGSSGGGGASGSW
ncbi:MAG: TPM domain-containing protein [bacterium]